MAKVVGLNHMGIVVENLEDMKAFFVDILGFQLKREYRCTDEATSKEHGLSSVDVEVAELEYSADSPIMKLLKYHAPKSLNSVRPEQFMIHDTGLHYSLEVRGIEEIYEKLVESGRYCIHAPVWHASGNAFLFCRDPEGNFCEMIQCGK